MRPNERIVANLSAALRLPLFAIFAASLYAFPTAALACSCANGDPIERLDELVGVVVFIGRAVERELHQGGSVPVQKFVRFEAVAYWRGDPDPRPIVWSTATDPTTHPSGQCGQFFELDRYWLVIAKQRANRLSTSVCGRSRPVRSAAHLKELLAVLGKPTWGDAPSLE